MLNCDRPFDVLSMIISHAVPHVHFMKIVFSYHTSENGMGIDPLGLFSQGDHYQFGANMISGLD